MSKFLNLSFQQEIHRKYIHLTSSIFAFTVLVFPKEILVPIFCTGTIFMIIIDLLRYRSRKMNDIFEFIFKGVMRPVEREQITGATYLLIGVSLTTLFFNKNIAATAMLFMSFSDTAAAIIGIGYGKTILWNSKTLEGSFAFMFTSILIVCAMPDIPIAIGLFAALIATFVELFTVPKINDNLLIPLITAIVLSLGI